MYATRDYNHLHLPAGAADEIAEELRACGHKVEKTETGELADWIKLATG